MVTAKVVCTAREEVGVGDNLQVNVSFAADYADDANKEWAMYTPALTLNMSLKGDVADRFQVGMKYTLQFVESD